MNYVTVVVNNKNSNLTEPFLHEKTIEEGEGFYINFQKVFKQCAENVLFGKVQVKKILNMEIEKWISDYKISEYELQILIKLYEGEYEQGSVRKELIDLMMLYWIKSENFQNKSSEVLEDFELGVNVKKKNKILADYDNMLPVGNLREFFRFLIYENYKPIENVVLNQYHKSFDRIHKTDNPLMYYISSGQPLTLQVMYGSNLYIPDIISEEDALNAISI